MTIESRIDSAESAQRRAEVARDQSERRYRQLVEHSLGLICVHDLDGRLLSVNPAAARSLGYEAHEGTGRNLRDYLAPETRHLFDDYLLRIREKGTDSGLMRVVAKDGSERVWFYQNIRYEEPGAPPYILGHGLDITDRVRIEQALRQSQHELRRAAVELDARVQERTAELRHANDMLAFLATASERLTRALDYESTLTVWLRCRSRCWPIGPSYTSSARTAPSGRLPATTPTPASSPCCGSWRPRAISGSLRRAGWRARSQRHKGK